MDILLELANGFGTERVGDHFALTCMRSSVAHVEEATLDRDECIVILATRVSEKDISIDRQAYALRNPFPWP